MNRGHKYFANCIYSLASNHKASYPSIERLKHTKFCASHVPAKVVAPMSCERKAMGLPNVGFEIDRAKSRSLHSKGFSSFTMEQKNAWTQAGSLERREEDTV